MKKVTVNKGNAMEVSLEQDRIFLNGKEVQWNLILTGNNRFHILKDGRSYQCEILKAVARNKSFEIKVNGNIYNADVTDDFDELLRSLGMDKAVSHKVNVIKAPMPGMVLKIMVSENQEIKEGDAVLILEAMKMENVIKSPGNGKVKSVKVNEHDAVEKNHVLIELD